ncbi:integral membrane protein [Colletotrichum scovillei]|nr:integral membrane protein [Colletotrichum scovillei]
MIEPAEVKGGPGLSIQLLDPSTPLYPGSVIRGHVTRKSHIVAASATIRIYLIGGSAASLHVQRGRSVVILDAGFEFWDRNAVSQVVHQGPLHIAPEPNTASQTWAFTLTVPLHTAGKALNDGLRRVQREASYLRAPGDVTGKQALPEQPLPASYAMTTCEGRGFVEYFLEAAILLEGRKMQPIEATLPVRVLSRPAPAVNTDFEMRGTMTEGSVTSHRLTPGMEHAELTWNQKRQMFLGSKRVPAWHFKLRVECPSVIQLGNPAAIPFRLNIIPDVAKSSKILRDVLQKVYLTNAVIKLLTIAGVSCPGTGEAHEGTCTETMTLHLDQAIAVKTGSLLVPSAAGERALELGAPLDACSRRAQREEKHHYPLGPDYTTYCFSFTHTLKWEFRLVIAGEPWECSGSQKVVVLPAVERVAAADTQSLSPPAGASEELPAYDRTRGPVPTYENVVNNGEVSISGYEKS